jgi:uncharacterized membrane protein YkvA (DUF1232 family)
MSTNKASGAVNGNLLNQWMQAGRLVMDSRVPFNLKLLLPFAAVLYWLWPIDLMPGLPFDDVAVLFFALTFFVKLANEAIEKTAANGANSSYSSGQTPNSGTASSSVANTGDNAVVDTTWRVIE